MSVYRTIGPLVLQKQKSGFLTDAALIISSFFVCLFIFNAPVNITDSECFTFLSSSDVV